MLSSKRKWQPLFSLILSTDRHVGNLPILENDLSADIQSLDFSGKLGVRHFSWYRFFLLRWWSVSQLLAKPVQISVTR